MTVIVGH